MEKPTLLILALFAAAIAKAGGGGAATMRKAFDCTAQFKEGPRLGQDLAVVINQNMDNFGGSRGNVTISGESFHATQGRALLLSDVNNGLMGGTSYVFRSDSTYILSMEKSFYFSLSISEKDQPAFSFLSLEEKLPDGTIVRSNAVLSCTGRFQG
jgi:hypothetical protein